MSSMRAAQVGAAGGPFEIVKQELPEPGPGQVRVLVEACGICHTDAVLVDGYLPGAAFPLVPANALAAIPDGLSAVDAAPLMCAGATTFNALRASGVQPGELVAVQGLGGVGHMGVQYAARMGFETVAIARGTAKEQAARDLGARHYIDSTAEDVAARLRELGGARVVLATGTESPAISACVDGLAPRGHLVVIGASAQPLSINPLQLIFGSHTVVGHASGTARQSEQTLAFSAQAGIRPVVETASLEDVESAFARMRSGEARFRMVLTTGN